MTFCELSTGVRYWFLFLGLIDTIVSCALFVAFVPERKNKGVHLHGIVLTVLAVLNQTYMVFVHKNNHDAHAFMFEPPFWINVALLVLSTISVVMGIKIVSTFGKSFFSSFSVVLAVNNMPISLSVSDENGKMILTNRSMYRTALKLLGEYPDNMEQFWIELKSGRINPEHHKLPSLKDDKPGSISISMDDGRILRFNRDVISMMGRDFIETTITDVTKLYEMYDEIEMGNWKLIDKRMELKLLTDDLINSNHEEEVLNNKIKIHNEMGELILATQVLLKNKDTLDAYKQKARDWEKITQMLFNVNKSKNIEAGKQLEEILDIAEQIGCKVIISEEVDQDIFNDSLARQAVREAIINAVRHGDASLVTIEDKSDNRYYGIRIENDGNKPEEIKMSGGLLNLQNGLRGKGGSLELEIEETFAIIVKLPKL